MALDGPVTIFTGVPRSGTTFLGEIAIRYLHVGAINEGGFELGLLRTGHAPGEALADARVAALLDDLSGDTFFDIVFDEVLSDGRPRPPRSDVRGRLAKRLDASTLRGLARAALAVAAEHVDCPRLGHEDPRFMEDLEGVLSLYPDVRLVHIIRDPRDVAVSVLRFPWGANNAVVAARDWDRDVRMARALGEALGPYRYLELRYEELLAEPGATLGRLMAFNGDRRSTAIAHFVESMERNPLRNNTRNWEDRLDRRALAGVEEMAHDLMVELGYAPALPRRRRTRWTESCWQLHHRVEQVRGILNGRLGVSGASHIEVNPARSADERRKVH